jgi:hypothetical protein
VAMRAAFMAVQGGKQVAVRPHHPAGPAALPELCRPFRRLAGTGGEPLPLP